MKNKGIILSIIGIIIVSLLVTIIINKNTKEYIMYDGAMLALTIDGESATSFPDSSNKYHVEVNCTGGTGKYQPVKVLDSSGLETDEYEMKFTVEDITGNVTCNIDFVTITNEHKLKTKVENDNPTNYNGYRYQGKEPNNWVWFNNEMWRIIGSIPTCTSSGCATSENLVKIIRSDSIGAYAYDAKSSGYTGAWGSNTLYSLLNTHYYATEKTAMNGQNNVGCFGYYDSSYKSQPNCDYSEIGILASSYYGQMVKNVYWNTGESDYEVTAATAYTNEMKNQTVSGYIGLMSASDWGYAADSSYYSTSMNSYSNATTTSWIYNNGYEWTNISYSSNTNSVIFVNNYGSLTTIRANYGCAIHPVVYLDPNVYIIDGNGTKGDPYIIGM